MLNIKIKKVHPNAVIPKYAKPGDAGMDLYVTSIEDETAELITYGFGLSIEIPEGYVGLIFPRSSVNKTTLSLSNSVGVIDSGYRGELRAVFRKSQCYRSVEEVVGGKLIGERLYPSFDRKYEVGDRAAQIMILPYPQVEFVESEELSTTERGEGGFGSTGN